uniref:Uncharacterized protein n=1 Tax=Anguilla anguilla TaxID=7936 RepID=A0A0E9PS83_ANGAN
MGSEDFLFSICRDVRHCGKTGKAVIVISAGSAELAIFERSEVNDK